MRYGIPDFKLEKQHIDRRLEQLAAEGVRFVTSCAVGVDVTVEELRGRHDAVLLAAGALAGRDMPGTPGRVAARGTPRDGAPGRGQPGGRRAGPAQIDAQLVGAATASDRSTPPAGTWSSSAAATPPPTAWAWRTGRARPASPSSTCTRCRRATGTRRATRGRRGRGSCASTRRTRRAASGSSRSRYRSSSRRPTAAGCDGIRIAEVSVQRVDGVRIVSVVPGTERRAARRPRAARDRLRGYRGGSAAGPARTVPQPAGALDCGPDWQTDAPGVFVAGDMHRGASLIVWAIAEGRAAAAAIHGYLGGRGQPAVPGRPGGRTAARSSRSPPTRQPRSFGIDAFAT